MNQVIASFVESLSLKDNNPGQLEEQWEEQDLEIKQAHLIKTLGQEVQLILVLGLVMQII
jgi:hypothetical protein